MDPLEKIFHWSWKTKKKLSQSKKPLYSVSLEDNKKHLSMLSIAFFERSILLKEAETTGGVVGNSLFLPASVEIFEKTEENYQFYIFKILQSQLALDLGLNLKVDKLSLTDHAVISLCSYLFIINKLKEVYPNLEKFIERVHEKELHNCLSPKKIAKINNKFNLIEKYLFSKEKNNSDLDSFFSKSLKTPEELIQKAIKLKKYIGIKVSDKKRYQLPLSISLLPVDAQILEIKKSKDSVIFEGELDESKTFKKAKPKERVKYIELDESDPDCNPVSLLMEAVNTIDLFSGGRKMVDGSDELDDHLGALEELEMRELTRSSTQTQSVFKADISVQVNSENEFEELSKSNFSLYSYPEWDYSKARYKENWCFVKEYQLEPTKLLQDIEDRRSKVQKNYRKEIIFLQQYIHSLFVDVKPKKRQEDGPEIDFDAVVSQTIDLKSGFSAKNNTYISKRRSVNEISLCILIDSSLSADSYVKGQKVLDITKDSVFIIQEVVEKYFANTMVASFYSNTRKNCSYNIVKDFGDKWRNVFKRMDEVTPAGYTRIGTALRHSLYKLKNMKTKKKVIILFSDGKPTDYDAYEGEYGISDVRQCVREGKRDSVDIISIAIDKDAKFYFPRLFGQKNYQIIEKPDEVAVKLIQLLSKLIK